MSIFQIPIKKVKGATVEINTDDLPLAIYEYALQIGLKELAARGASKLKKEDYATESAYNAEAKRVAEEQVQNMYAGKTRIVGAKATGAKKGAEHTEAMRLARLEVKAQLKAAGKKISAFSAADISKAATALINADQDTWYAAARESLAKLPQPTKGIDLAAILHEDPKKVAAAEAKAAKAKATREAKKGATAPVVAAKGKGGNKSKPGASTSH